MTTRRKVKTTKATKTAKTTKTTKVAKAPKTVSFETVLKKLKTGKATRFGKTTFTATKYIEMKKGELLRVSKNGTEKACRLTSQAVMADDWFEYKEA